MTTINTPDGPLPCFDSIGELLDRLNSKPRRPAKPVFDYLTIANNNWVVDSWCDGKLVATREATEQDHDDVLNGRMKSMSAAERVRMTA